jgi:alanine racemase
MPLSRLAKRLDCGAFTAAFASAPEICPMNKVTDDLTATETTTWTGDTSSPLVAPFQFDNARPPRPAWIELDLARWRNNYHAITRSLPASVRLLAVIKDEAYGHGLLPAARIATEAGVNFFAVSTVEEAVQLRDGGVRVPILLLGERQESELSWCVAHNLTCCVSETQGIARLGQIAARAGKRVPVHLKINTGMNRYGARSNEVLPAVESILAEKSLRLEGALSHFAQSDELDKTFALLQLARFNEALDSLQSRGISIAIRHLCNSGGFLDLPAAHFDMVRMGILPLGVFPSSVCRRIPGIEAVMSVKARIAAIQNLQPGDHVGYGMRYTATENRRIAVLPIGYGDGFPRVRNLGHALIHGKRAPIVGGVSMDALTVDITDIPEAKLWDVATLMGRDGGEEISVHDIAKLKNSASYDVLCSWRSRLPHIYLNDEPAR